MSEEEICEAGRVGLCDPEDKRHEAFLAERARTGTASGELTYVRKDGTKIIAEVTKGLGAPMRGIASQAIPEGERLAVRGW